jgi:hypothetical protein
MRHLVSRKLIAVVLACAICLHSLHGSPVSICNAPVSKHTNKQVRSLTCFPFRSLQTSLAAARFVAFVRMRGSRSYFEAHLTRQAHPRTLLEDRPFTTDGGSRKAVCRAMQHTYICSSRCAILYTSECEVTYSHVYARLLSCSCTAPHSYEQAVNRTHGSDWSAYVYSDVLRSLCAYGVVGKPARTCTICSANFTYAPIAGSTP